MSHRNLTPLLVTLWLPQRSDILGHPFHGPGTGRASIPLQSCAVEVVYGGKQRSEIRFQVVPYRGEASKGSAIRSLRSPLLSSFFPPPLKVPLPSVQSLAQSPYYYVLLPLRHGERRRLLSLELETGREGGRGGKEKRRASQDRSSSYQGLEAPVPRPTSSTRVLHYSSGSIC